MECVYCKIIRGDLPSYEVYRDEKVVAFLDVLPISPGHTIVVPVAHAADLESLEQSDFCAMSAVVKKVGQAVTNGLGVKGYSIFLDNKSAANQHVPHVHFHVVPRVEGDGLGRWPQGAYGEGEAENIVKKIASNLK